MSSTDHWPKGFQKEMGQIWPKLMKGGYVGGEIDLTNRKKAREAGFKNVMEAQAAQWSRLQQFDANKTAYIDRWFDKAFEEHLPKWLHKLCRKTRRIWPIRIFGYRIGWRDGVTDGQPSTAVALFKGSKQLKGENMVWQFQDNLN